MIAGVGGQGSVLASRLVAEAAMRRGCDVRTTETIGMAQRGGSVVSHVRIGDSSTVHSPLIPPGKAHALIAFEPAEAVRQLPFLADGGKLIVCDSAVMPVAGALSGQTYNARTVIAYIKSKYPKALIINGQPLRAYSAKTLNVALLGAAAQAGAFPFGAGELLAIVSEMARYREQNIKSFEMGMAEAQKSLQ